MLLRSSAAKSLHRDRVVGAVVAAAAMRVHDLAHEGGDGHAGERVGVLEGEEHAEARTLVGLELEQVDALEADGSRGHLVGGMAHQDVRQGGLAGAVRAHDRVDLATRELEVDPLEDLLAVDRGVEPLNLEVAHEAGAFRRTPGSGRTVRNAEGAARTAPQAGYPGSCEEMRRNEIGAALCWTRPLCLGESACPISVGKRS